MFTKIFPAPKKENKFLLYLNPEFKQSIQVEDQEVSKFLQSSNNLEQAKSYNMLLIIKNKKNQTVLKRKLNKSEKFSQVLAQVDPEYKGYLVLGYDEMKSQSTKPIFQNNKIETQITKYIRSGILFKYSEKREVFQQCQFKLHPDYLMYHKIKKKEKISFVPLDNANIEIIDQNKHIFSIVQKFKTIKLKSLSKQDMRGWLLSISETIRIKYQQRYVSNLSQKVAKHQNEKVKKYHQQCKMLLQQQRLLLSDPKGRAALKQYFKKNVQKEGLVNDVKILNLINKYHYYCQLLREQAEQAKQVLKALKLDLKQLYEYLKINININLQKILETNENKFNSDVYKVFESISYYMGCKYHNILLNQKYLYNIILNYAVNNYKQNNKIHLMSILNKCERNKL